MPRISQLEVNNRSQAIMTFFKNNESATYKQLAEHLGISKPSLYQWMKNNSSFTPWYYCKNSRQIRYPECCRQLEYIFESTNFAPVAIDKFLDWIKTANDPDGPDLIFEMHTWCNMKPRGPMTDLLVAVVNRVRERVQSEETLPVMWQDPLLVASLFVPYVMLKEMLDWYGEGDDWKAVRARILDELGISANDSDQQVFDSAQSERELLSITRDGAVGRVFVTQDGKELTVSIGTTRDLEDVSPESVDRVGKEVHAWLDKNMLPRCDIKNLPYDPALRRTVFKEYHEGNCAGIFVAECDSREENAKLIGIVGSVDETRPVSQADRAKVKAQMASLTMNEVKRIIDDDLQAG